MGSNFKIYQCAIGEARPPISYKICEYFEQFVKENILERKKIIIGGSWNIHLTINFLTTGPKVLFNGVALGNGATTVKSEAVKLYSALILIEPIQEAENPLLKTVELMYEAIKLFFTKTYKKISREFMDELWNQIDVNYLLSLPYPAPFAEQRYFMDDQKYTVEPDGTIRLTTIEEQAWRTGYKGKLNSSID